MIETKSPQFGRPGDVILVSSEATVIISNLQRPDTRFDANGRYGVGLQLSDEDLRQVAGVMRDAFAKAHPDVKVSPALPIRQNRAGVWLLFASTTKQPACLDERRQPIEPPDVGSIVMMSSRIAPYHRTETGKAGVACYLNWVRLAPITATGKAA